MHCTFADLGSNKVSSSSSSSYWTVVLFMSAHPAVSPFLCIMITEAFFQLFGSLPSLRHLLNTLVNI